MICVCVKKLRRRRHGDSERTDAFSYQHGCYHYYYHRCYYHYDYRIVLKRERDNRLRIYCARNSVFESRVHFCRARPVFKYDGPAGARELTTFPAQDIKS